jgi:signal transduction histidine kinase
VRARLALQVAGLVLATSAALLSVLYLTAERSIARQPIEVPIVSAAPVSGLPAGDDQAAVEFKQQLSAAERDLRDGVRRHTLPPLLHRGLPTLGLVTLTALGIGWAVAGRTLRPIQRVTDTARRITGSNLHERVEPSGPRDEMRELADAVDGMLARLDQAFDGQRRFVGNASHELKTPLAVNRTLLEVAISRPGAPEQLRNLGETLLEVTGRQERLLDGLLTLARSERTLADAALLDLAELTEAVVEVARPEAALLGVSLQLDTAEVPVEGDQALLERLVQNLVENALQYNTSPGWIRVAVDRDGGDARLVVANTGPAVPASAIPRLFEPFRRATDRVGSARGTGLGLSIVRSVATAHGGHASAAPRDGGGLIVEVRVPLGRMTR